MMTITEFWGLTADKILSLTIDSSTANQKDLSGWIMTMITDDTIQFAPDPEGAAATEGFTLATKDIDNIEPIQTGGYQIRAKDMTIQVKIMGVRTLII